LNFTTSNKYNFIYFTPLSTLYNSLILKGLKFNSFLAKNCKPSIYRALEKRVESQVFLYIFTPLSTLLEGVETKKA
jgi:hypothetical protein